MENFKVLNENNIIGVQHNIGRDINIHNHHPQISNVNATDPVEFHFTEATYSFSGRCDELQKVEELFFVKKQKMVVVCGCAGYGKTELARKFVRQCKDDKRITHILWMEAETSDKLMQSFKDLAKVLQLPEVDDRTLVKNVYQYFESSSCVIVFDNAINRKQILQFEPKGKCLCLVTSHVKDWGDNVPSLELASLLLDAAVNVLRVVLGDRFQEQDMEVYKELANTVSCVPLALQVTAAYVRQEMCDLADDFNLREHLQHVRKSCEEFINHPVPDSNNYDKSVAQAVQISLHKIKTINTYISKLAYDILHVCAYLYPEKILHSELLEMKNLLENSQNHGNDVKRACSLLSNYSFISNINEKVTIHRLIQNILIFYQDHLSNQNYFYSSCLEYLLVHTDNNHSQLILQERHTEQHLATFRNFYLQNKSNIISTQSFLHNLVFTGCKLFLTEILNDLNNEADDIISNHCLLLLAARYRQHGVLELLLERGADVNIQYSHETALKISTELLDLRAVKLLTSHKADVNVVDADGDSLLHLFILKSGKAEFSDRREEVCDMLRWLAKCGARTDVVSRRGGTLLHVAAFVLSAELIHCLVHEFHQSVHSVNINGETPLYYVSQMLLNRGKERRLWTAACLLENGARLDHKDVHGRTPAQAARICGYEYLASYFEDFPTRADFTETRTQKSQLADKFKAFVTTRQRAVLTQKLDEFGEDAANKINEYCLLHEAAAYRHCDMVELLLAHGASTNTKGDGDTTALHLAAANCDQSIMEMLVSHGADVNATNVAGNSILRNLILYFKGHEQPEGCEVLRWLIKHGARTDDLGPHGESLLHTAAFVLRPDLIDCLIDEFHIDVNGLDSVGNTPVFHLIAGMQENADEEARGIITAVCLLEHGARLDVVAMTGLTPIALARNSAFKTLAIYLQIEQHNEVLQADSQSDTETQGTSTDIDTASAADETRQLLQRPDTQLAAAVALGERGRWEWSQCLCWCCMRSVHS